MSKEIYLIRHTTPAIEKGICYGQTDIEVAETFQKEVNDLKDIISKFEIGKAFSSPLKRCRYLVEAICPDIVSILDDRLQEMNFGDWEMMSWDQISENQLKNWGDHFVATPVPNGESFLELYKRSVDCYKDIIDFNGNSLIVTHAGVIRSILVNVLEMPLNKAFSIKLNYGSVIKIIQHDSFSEVEFIKV